MTMIKRICRTSAACAAITMLAVSLYTEPAQASKADAVQASRATVAVNGKNYTFDYINVDLTDPRVRVGPVIAQGGIGHVEKLSSMAKRTEAVAAINGTYFDAYNKDTTKQYPYGLLLNNGEVLKGGQNQSLIIQTNRKASIEQASIGVSFSVTPQNKGARSYNFSPWSVNVYYGDQTEGQIVCFTPSYGTSISYPNATYILVEDGRIKQIVNQAEAVIPRNGYVIYIQGKNDYVLNNVHVGDAITMNRSMSGDQGKMSSQDWIAAIGVGPKLITKGKVDIDHRRDGFTEAKITTNAAGRSFVGIDGKDRLVLGVFPAVTLQDMAEALLSFGLVEAMNMDGGASSGLYYNNTMKRTPGRELSNALIVQYMEHPQVQLTVNGQFVHEFRGFTEDGATMVPFRGIFERIQANFTWDAAKQQITASRGGGELVLSIGNPIATLNGESVTMPKAPELRDGWTYIPLRFVTEKLGAKLDWNPELYQATITME